MGLLDSIFGKKKDNKKQNFDPFVKNQPEHLSGQEYETFATKTNQDLPVKVEKSDSNFSDEIIEEKLMKIDTDSLDGLIAGYHDDMLELFSEKFEKMEEEDYVGRFSIYMRIRATQDITKTSIFEGKAEEIRSDLNNIEQYYKENFLSLFPKNIVREYLSKELVSP